MTTKTPGQAEADRNAFEAWARKTEPWSFNDFTRDSTYVADGYDDIELTLMWQAWQAAHLSTHPPASGGVAHLGMTVEQLAAAIEFGGGSAWPAEKVEYLHRLIGGSISAAPEAPTSQAPDTLRLDFMSAHRVAVIPEMEGGWDAEEFNEDGEGCRVATGQTVRGAIDAARAALEAPKP